MEDAFLAAVKQAFQTSNINGDCTFTYTAETTMVGVLAIDQCIVEYDGGNEYLRLDTLIELLKNFGDIERIEYRGRGRSEAIQILFEFKFDDRAHQLIYVISK